MSHYETITLSSGENPVLSVGSNETIENILIDQRASNSHLTIRPEDGAENWTIRNIGWKGKPDGGKDSGTTDFLLLIPGCGDGLIENIYIDAKDYDGTGNTYIGGGHLSTYYYGRCELRHCYIEGLGNNAFYANMPATSGGSDGTVHYYDCLHRDNTPSNFRPGAHGSTIDNCVSIVSDPYGYRGYYYTNDSQLCRPMWHWDGTTHINDMAVYINPDDVQPHTAFLARHQHSNDSTHCALESNVHVNSDSPTSDYGTTGGATMDTSGLGHSPSMDVMVEGVPTSPEMAAEGNREIPTTELGSSSGGGGGGGTGDTLNGDDWAFISETGTSEVMYEFRVEPNDNGNLNVEFYDAPYTSPSGDPIEGGTWEAEDFIDDRGDVVYAGGGTGGGHGDAYDITGDVTHVWINNPDDMFIWVNEQDLDPNEVTFTNTRPTNMDFDDGDGSAGGDYETITVGANSVWTYSLSDGETFSNKLIDISADGAEVEIKAHADNWTIRNIGFSGVWDTLNREYAFIDAAVLSEGATGTIDNVYIGDGAINNDYPDSPNGVFVPQKHAGTLTINNLHVSHLADNAVYGSPPGQDGAGDGAVIIKNSYADDLDPAAWRVGGSGSRVENCVAVNTNRGVWNRHSTIDVVDCDLTQCSNADIVVHSASQAGNEPNTYATNTYWETDIVESGSVLEGTPADRTPRTSPEEVDGVPLGPIEAASGTSSGGDGGGGTTDYDVIEADNSHLYLNDGDTLENVIIDYSNGNWLEVQAVGDDVTIRNVGFRGTHEYDNHGIVASGGGQLTIENVYMGDGCVRPADPNNYGQMGIYFHPDFTGEATIESVNVQNWPNNGIYASAASGPVTIQNCYGRGNYVSTFRVGDDGTIRDSVAEGGNGRYAGRPAWCWGSNSRVENCQLDGDGYHTEYGIFVYDNAHAYVEGTTHSGVYTKSGAGWTDGGGNNQYTAGTIDTSMPAGVPTSPEAAADGYDNNYSGGDTTDPSGLEPVAHAPLGGYDVPLFDPSNLDLAESRLRFDVNNQTLAARTVTGTSGSIGFRHPNTGEAMSVSLEAAPSGDAYETFQDGLAKYFGDTGQYSTATDGSDDDAALASDTSHGSLLTTTTGPSRGEQFAIDFKPANETGDIFLHYFATQDTTEDPDRYLVGANHDTGTLRFGEYVNGSYDWTEASFDTAGTGGQYNTVYVDFDSNSDGTITVWYEEPDGTLLASLEATSTAFDAGGFGWALWTTESVSTLNARLDALRPTTATVPDPQEASGGQDYTVITLDQNESVTYDLSDGETFENVLIDQTASGATYAIRARDKTDWTIRNVGFLGVGDRSDSDAANQHMLLSCPSGGSGVVENVFMSNYPTRYDADENSPMGGMYVRDSHAGHIDFRHTYVEGMGNNASYADRPGRSGGGGTVRYENCFHRNNTVSQFRIGTSGSEIVNSIGLVDDPHLKRASYISSDSKRARGVWGWHNTDLWVRNSTICVDPDDGYPGATFHARMHDDSSGTECVLNVEDSYVHPRDPNRVKEGPGTATVNLSNITEEPTADVLANGGVPTSPKMAASGGREYVDPFGEDTQEAQDFDVITLDPWEQRRYRLDDGETFSNKLIDQTAEGARFTLKATGSNWAIKNVGWYGKPTDDDGDGRHVMNVSTPSGGHGVIENCYANGKLTPDDEDTDASTMGGFRVRPAHAGHIDFRSTYIEGFGNNASYADSMGEEGDGNGSITYTNCYHRDNTVSQFRIGGRGSLVQNSVAIVDDPNGDRGQYPYSGSYNARGIWGRHQIDLEMRNSTLYLNHSEDINTGQNAEARRQSSSGSDVELTIDEVYTDPNPVWNERDETGEGRAYLNLGRIYEGEPTVTVLGDGGVPTTAQMAAEGRRTYPDPFGENPGREEYDVITVGAGETFTKTVGTGEVWENKLIDITADGAGYRIHADGDDWTIRNIGVRGTWDYDPGSQQFLLETTTNALVENVYLGDGTVSGVADPGGMFVMGDHSGTLTIRNCNIQDFPDNGIYGSDPGASHTTGRGAVQIENVYTSGNGNAGLRIGTDGSYVRNCVSYNDDSRGFWGLFSDTLEAINCDFSGNNLDIRLGSSSQESDDTGYADLTVDNTYFGTYDEERSQNDLIGSSVSRTPRTSPEEVTGVPLSPEAAASGVDQL